MIVGKGPAPIHPAVAVQMVGTTGALALAGHQLTPRQLLAVVTTYQLRAAEADFIGTPLLVLVAQTQLPPTHRHPLTHLRLQALVLVLVLQVTTG